MGEPAEADRTKPPFAFEFDRTLVPPLSNLAGVAIKDANIRKFYDVTIVGIQRDGKRIVSPPAEEILQEEDILLLMGSEHSLEMLKTAILQNEVQVR